MIYQLSRVIEGRLEEIRKSWLSGVRKVVSAPIGHVVQVLPPDVKMSIRSDAIPVRITNNKEAPAYKLETPDSTYPYRQKEVIENVNKKLRGKKIVNQYDILCVRRVYGINESRPDFYYKPMEGLNIVKNLLIGWLSPMKKIPHFLIRRERSIMKVEDKYVCLSISATAYNKRVSSYGASHLCPNPSLSLRASHTRKTLSEMFRR